MPNQSHTDLATLAHLARDGSLDLTSVALRVRTDLLVSSLQPLDDDIRSFTMFALAALPRLAERDVKIISHKLAGWPHTSAELKQALIARLPEAEGLFLSASMATSAPVIQRQPIPIMASEPASANDDGDDELRAHLLDRTMAADSMGLHGHSQSDAIAMTSDPVGLQIELAQNALASGNIAPGQALLARSDLRAADHAPFFLLASPVQQSLILSGLEQLQKLQPQQVTPRPERDMIEALMETASTDRAGAFLGLAAQVSGTPEFAAAMTLDKSRKLTGLAFLALGASIEDAVRFAIKLGDESSSSVAVIFSLVETLRLANPVTAFRLLRAIGGKTVLSKPQRTARYIPAADPSGTPVRGAQATLAPHENRGASNPLQIVRKLTGG